MNLAVIPARGGSKRIPRKNIKSFSGKPIIVFSIEAALSSKLFDRVIVSTEDQEIAEIAEKYGAEVPFMRPVELADDFTGVHSVVAHTVRELRLEGFDYDYICMIYATAPFIRPDEIVKGFKIIQESNYHSVLAVTQFSYPIYRSFFYNDSGKIEMLFPEHFF